MTLQGKSDAPSPHILISPGASYIATIDNRVTIHSGGIYHVEHHYPPGFQGIPSTNGESVAKKDFGSTQCQQNVDTTALSKKIPKGEHKGLNDLQAQHNAATTIQSNLQGEEEDHTRVYKSITDSQQTTTAIVKVDCNVTSHNNRQQRGRTRVSGSTEVHKTRSVSNIMSKLATQTEKGLNVSDVDVAATAECRAHIESESLGRCNAVEKGVRHSSHEVIDATSPDIAFTRQSRGNRVRKALKDVTNPTILENAPDSIQKPAIRGRTRTTKVKEEVID